MKILILGCAGSGKTTISKRLSREFSIPAISSDEIFFDENWRKRCSLGIKTKMKFFF